MWNAKESNVEITLPNGSTQAAASVSAEDINVLALAAGLVQFEVKDSDGNQLEAGDFPVTTGSVIISEYNEAKAWTAEAAGDDVTVNMPDGTEEQFDELTAEDVNELALEAGLVQFEVKDESGNQLEVSNFPVTSGSVTISEYNEAKAWKAEPVNDDVSVNMPDGTGRVFEELTAGDVNELALEAGLVQFEVKDADGNQLEVGDFPVTTGEVTISEYNEAKAIQDALTQLRIAVKFLISIG